MLWFQIFMLCILPAAYTTMLKSNQITHKTDNGTVHRTNRQARVEVNLSQEQMQQLLDIHNKYRAMEGSSDMKHLRWNSVLAQMGQSWAEMCNWAHGQPQNFDEPYSALGQNLWATTANPVDVRDGITAFYEEKQFYDYDTLQCEAGEICGHYTQVVWADTEEVGCGLAVCPQLYSTNLRNANYLVCNYGPSGNYGGEKPFRKGAECSACRSGSSWCTQGLCNSQCDSANSNCECQAACHNCGVYQADTCSCDCPTGWGLADCSEPCTDFSPTCGIPPGGTGWPASWCATHDYVDRSCPALCGRCVIQSPPEKSGCPVSGPGKDKYGNNGGGLPRLGFQTSGLCYLITFTVILYSTMRDTV